MNDTIRMQLSAFIDDELPENEAELLLRRVCQDEELRKEAAEYLAISRLIRNEAGFAGADRLHERIAAEIEDGPKAARRGADESGSSRFVRPLAGVAIAASVALLAIFGLQQIDVSGDAGGSAGSSAPIAEVTPQLTEEQRRQFQLHHDRAVSQQGASSIKARLATMPFSEYVEEDAIPESELDEPIVDDAAEETDETDPTESAGGQ